MSGTAADGHTTQTAPGATLAPAHHQLFVINNFDLVRLFAALQVAVLHAYHRFELPLPALLTLLSWFPGVPIFFVISGYLISASLQRSDSLLGYARNRALRILPGLWGVLLATLLALALLGFAEASPRFILWFGLQAVALIYTPAFLSGFADGTYNGSLWTIPIELQFYCVLPVLYLLMRRSKVASLRFLLIVTLLFVTIAGALAIAFPEMGVNDRGSAIKLVRYTFVPRFYMFLFGVLLQHLAIYRSPLVRGRGLFWLAAYMLVRAVLPQTGLWYMVAELLLAVTAISLAYSAPTLGRRLLRGHDLSYGIYLYHGLFIGILIELAVPTQTALPLTLSLSIMAGAASWIAIERPMIRSKRLRGRPVVVPQVVAAPLHPVAGS